MPFLIGYTAGPLPSRPARKGEGNEDDLEPVMCRNIRTLFNFDPPATDEEIHDAALQFVRKLSGTTKPSKRNEAAFEHAVSSITACARELLDSLETAQPPRNREEEAAKARARSATRFA
jgi:hypothetical protein